MLFARISPDDVILYANSALAAYLGVEKDVLVGAPLESLAQLLHGEMADCFSREAKTGNMHQLVVDEQGLVFEFSRNSDGAVLDLVFTEVTDPECVLEGFRSSIAFRAEDLSETEMRSILHPERRIVTLSRTRLCGLDEMASTHSPADVLLIVNIFLEEAQEAILKNGSSLGDLESDEVEGIHGMPRHYEDHTLRCLDTVSAQFANIAKIRAALHRVGKEIPALAAGIAGGEVFLTAVSAQGGKRIAASGPSAALTAHLCRLARPGEILISQFALSSLLSHLPSGWQYMLAKTEEEADLSDLVWMGDEIQCLPDHLLNHVYLVGPDVENQPENCVFYFSYLYSLKSPGFDNPVPVLRAVRPENADNSIDFSEEKIVSTPVVQVLGKYKLLSVIGQGGMGKVWRAQDRFGNTVAIKVLNSAETASEDTVRRFQREAEIMAKLPHRNICRIFEISTYDDIQFIAMEFVDGLTLADLLYEGLDAGDSTKLEKHELSELIKSLRVSRSVSINKGSQPIAETHQRPKVNRILPTEQALVLFGKICDGVQFSHEHGILHRDLKPGNVLLREDGEPLVADFGLAKLEKEDEVSLSISGHVVGTIENMAPEQAESSKDVDERADIYSLGTILYQMITGHRHFHSSGNILQDAQALSHHTQIRPRQHNRKIDPDLELICMKALRANPNERYRSVAALKADLERYRRGEMISARAVTPLELSKKLIQRHRGVSAVIAGSLLILAGLASLSFWQINQKRLEAEAALKVADAALQDAKEQALRADAASAKINEAWEASEKHRLEAEQKQRETEDALAKGRETTKALEVASKETVIARKQVERERAAKDQIKETAQNLQEKLNNRKHATDPTPTTPSQEFVAPSSPIPPVRSVALQQADQIYANLNPMELRNSRSRPDEIQKNVLEGLSQVSQALLTNDRNPYPHYLKGMFHLAMHEIVEARQELTKVLELDRVGRFRERDNVGKLLEFLDKIETRVTSPIESLIRHLQSSFNPRDANLAELLSFPLTKRVAKQMNGFSGKSRQPTLGEAFLDIQSLNPGSSATFSVQETPGQVSLTIENASSLSNLSPLKNLSIQELSVAGLPAVDWSVLGSLKLRKLALTDTSAKMSPPIQSSGFGDLLEANFRNTSLDSVSFLSLASKLEALDISNTKVKDLTPLSHPSHLKTLRLEGTQPDSLLTLMRFPLEDIFIDSAIAADAKRLKFPRMHRTLKAIHTPEDPEGLAPLAFWAKQERGDYQSPVPTNP